MPRTVIIGAGIGGLTAAVAFSRQGWDVTVLERAPELRPVGSGLAIGANALKALDVIGLGDQVRALSRVQGIGGIKTAKGRYLTRTTEAEATARWGDSVVLLKRADLMTLLADALPAEALHLDTEVLSVHPGKGAVETATSTYEADLVIAADGINSRTRATVFPDHPSPVYSGTTAWRALVDTPLPIEISETWGDGSAFGVMPLADDTVYLYATARLPAGTHFKDEKAELLARFSHWHPPIPALLSAADPSKIIRNDIYHQPTPLPAYHQDRTVLLGDAAHPMTPNLGQGACQAIEDAIVLSLDPTPASYTAARLPRTTAIVTRSARVNKTIALTSPLPVAARNTTMRALSRATPHLLLKSFDDVLGWTPPKAP